MAPRKIIIDTDPGIDDILAILLAFSAMPEELQVLLISVTYGNTDLQSCLRNVITLFHQVEQEIEWRKSQGLEPGFSALKSHKPIVAVGPDHPLTEQTLMADFFHGRDGLGGIHETHPHMTPAENWRHLFQNAEVSSDPAEHAIAEELQNPDAFFTTTKNSGTDEILRLLRENEPDTITIVAIGPLTNLALAASIDPETFLRAKEIVIMGGNVDKNGNMTPCAEFNTYADAFAAARLYALSSPTPSTTIPPQPPSSTLHPYPTTLSRQLKITLFPLDITERHMLTRGQFRQAIQPLLAQNSPLATWVEAFLTSTYLKIESLQRDVSGDAVGLQLHDPLCIWYCLSSLPSSESWQMIEDEDLRVETAGQWTRGMCVVDRRTRQKRKPGDEGEKAGDEGNWLSLNAGNRLRRCVGSPGEDLFGEVLLQRIFQL